MGVPGMKGATIRVQPCSTMTLPANAEGKLFGVPRPYSDTPCLAPPTIDAAPLALQGHQAVSSS